MSNQICTICQKPKAKLECGICKEPICKNCTQFVDENYFSFCKVISKNLSFTSYCGTCFNQEVEPAIESYEQMMQKAREVSLFYKDQGKETRRMSRLERPIVIENCLDKDELILRLAFRAVEENFNTLVDVDLVSQKVKQGNYQHLIWKGTAVPISLEPEKLKHK